MKNKLEYLIRPDVCAQIRLYILLLLSNEQIALLLWVVILCEFCVGAVI